jgi:hypothetical protein
MLRVSTQLRLLGNAPLGRLSNVLRPITMVWPVVSALKRFRSFGNQYISLFSNPMALLRATAAIILIILLVQN